MYEIHKRVRAIRTSDEGRQGWEDRCVKVPVVNLDEVVFGKKRRRRKREKEDFFDDSDFDAMREGRQGASPIDPAVLLYPDGYCPIVEALPMECYEVRYREKMCCKSLHDERSIGSVLIYVQPLGDVGRERGL